MNILDAFKDHLSHMELDLKTLQVCRSMLIIKNPSENKLTERSDLIYY